MRKTILMLINGFGVERNGSAEVYSAKLMPNFDALIKTNLFGNLVANAGDYNNAYKQFSIPEKAKGYEDEIDYLIFEKKLDQNQVLLATRDSLNGDNKMHVFFTLEGVEKFNQFKEIIKIINPNKDKKIFVHLLLTATSIDAYDNLTKVISKVAFEMSEYCKIGMVVGSKRIDDDDVRRAFYRELGEHWNESNKKFAILKKEIVNPEDAGVFIITGGFALKENDSVLFINYSNVQMDKFYADFTKVPVKLFSLYPMRNDIPYMFKKDDEKTVFFASQCEKFNIRILHLTTESRINDVNFYLNGMQKVKSPNITYAVNDTSLFVSKDAVIKLIEESDYEGYIIDYSFAGYNKMDIIKKDLSSIDAVIKNISDAAKEKDYTFIVSSLYGIHAPVMDGVVQKVIDFSGKVPIMFQSNLFTKAEYSLNPGNTYGLSQTFLTNINDEVKANKLVHKLSNVEKMLTKGK